MRVFLFLFSYPLSIIKFNPYLDKLYQSDKPIIIYKVDSGYNIYTDFSKRIILTKKNIKNFLQSFKRKKYRKETDIYLGFFGYEILCNLIGINIKDKKRINFYKGIFYKPETIIKIRRDIKILSKIIQERTNLGLPIDSSVANEFQKSSKHLNFLYGKAIDGIYEFFKLDSILNNSISKPIFSILNKNQMFKRYSNIFSDEGLNF